MKDSTRNQYLEKYNYIKKHSEGINSARMITDMRSLAVTQKDDFILILKACAQEHGLLGAMNLHHLIYSGELQLAHTMIKSGIVDLSSTFFNLNAPDNKATIAWYVSNLISKTEDHFKQIHLRQIVDTCEKMSSVTEVIKDISVCSAVKVSAVEYYEKNFLSLDEDTKNVITKYSIKSCTPAFIERMINEKFFNTNSICKSLEGSTLEVLPSEIIGKICSYIHPDDIVQE